MHEHVFTHYMHVANLEVYISILKHIHAIVINIWF